MARKIVKVEQVVDDIDGQTAAECVTFAVGDVTYEIDLSPQNKERLQKALDPFVKHARIVPRRRPAAKHAAPNSDHVAPFAHHAARVENLTRRAATPSYNPLDLFRPPAEFASTPATAATPEPTTTAPLPSTEPALPGRDPNAARDPNSSAIRAWAAKTYGVGAAPARGRIPADISSAFYAQGTPEFAGLDRRIRERLASAGVTPVKLPTPSKKDIAHAQDNADVASKSSLTNIARAIANGGLLAPEGTKNTDHLLRKGFAARDKEGNARINGAAIALYEIHSKRS
jgi:hypothetical protein